MVGKAANRPPFLFSENNMNYPVAAQSHKQTRADDRLRAYLAEGKSRRNDILEKVARTVIKDALVHPRDLTFSHAGTIINVTAKDRSMRMHQHALRQMSSVLEYPITYLNKLQEGVAGIETAMCREKLCADLTWHAHNAVLFDRKKQDAKYLVRHVDGEIRAFLSRSFKRHLSSGPLLGSFVQSCDRMGLHPVDGYTTDIRVGLHCALPYVFEPYDGEFVALGVSWSNSDFGGGRMKVSTFMKRIHGGASYIVDDAISAVHVGSVIEESDIELSQETLDAELVAQKRVIEDVVASQMSTGNVEKLLEVIGKANEEKVPWHKLRRELGSLLQKKELEKIQELLKEGSSSGFEDLPPISYDKDGDPVATRWWASTVIGQMAVKEDNPDRKKDLQELAGGLLSKTKEAA